MALPGLCNRIDAILAFIESYRQHPELWDVKNIHYVNRIRKARAYEVLIEKLNVIEPDATRDSVVKKIKNLRTAFRKELKKINDSKKCGTSSEHLYVPSLWYFQELMFLVDHERENKDSTMSKEYNDGENSGTAPNLPNAGAHPTSSFTALSRKRRLLHGLPGAQDLLTKATQYLEMEDDECLTLAKGYATKLRKLSPKQLMYVDKVINEALFDAQMGLMTPGSHLIHSEVLGPYQTDKVL